MGHEQVEREAMEYDIVVVGAGPGGLATAIRLKQLASEAGREISVCVLEKGSEPGAHILSGAIMDPRQGHAALAAPRLLQERRQLHRQPGRGDALAGAAGRSAGRGDLPRLRRRRGAVRRGGRGQGRGHRRHGHRQGRPADRPVPARHGTARQVHDLRRGFARPAGTATHREVPARCRQGSAKLWHRHQGTVASGSGEAPARPGGAHRRLAAGQRHLRRLVPTTPKAGRSRSASWSAWTTGIRG